MSYIGNGKSLLIIGSNTKDDLIPDEVNKKSVFTLSQEVPGGYESNITVLRQKYTTTTLVQSSTKIAIGAGTLPGSNPAVAVHKVSSSDQNVASVLAKVVAGGDLTISVQTTPASASYYNNTFRVAQVDYLGTSINIYILPVGSGTSTSVNSDANPANNTAQVSITFGQLSDWSILEPEKDYIISGQGSVLNRILELTEYPKTKDKVYVLHKGEATYNFAPSVGSVGVNQLSENLRNFTCDRYTADGTTATFSLSGTDADGYTVVDAKSLLVTVDDSVYDSDGIDSQGASVTGKWKLNLTRDTLNRQTITFNTGYVPAAGKKIRILHLGFSTVSRRAGFAQGTVPYQPALASVGTNEIQNEAVTGTKLAPASVSTGKISPGAVTSDRILLTNDVALKGSSSSGTEVNLLKITSSNKTSLNGTAETLFCISDVEKVSITSTSVRPLDSISLGTSGNKFTDAYLSGSVNAATASFTGNVNAGSINSVNITTLKNDVDALTTSIPNRFGAPIGSIVMWPLGSADGDGLGSIPKNWRRCDGQALNTYTFRKLHKLLSNKYGGQQYQSGTTDVSSATSLTFNLPDLRSRFPVGPNSTNTDPLDRLVVGQTEGLDGAGSSLRKIKHTHKQTAHTHTFDHTHYVPAHYHSVGSGTGATLQVSVASGGHTTKLDHTHANASADDVIDWQPNGSLTGNHVHSGTTNLCSSLEHVHRSWPYINISRSTPDPSATEDATLDKLGGSQWYETLSGSLQVVDTKDTGVVRQDDVGVINNHTHNIPCSPFPSTLTQPHTHSNVTYDSASSNIGDSTVSTGTSYTPAAPSTLTRISGTVSSGTAANLSLHTHKIVPFYTDFPYKRSSSDLSSTLGGSGPNFHSDIQNRRTTLKHTHSYATPNTQGGHYHDVRVTYRGTDSSDINRGLHTHSASSFSGSIGQVASKATSTTVQSRTGRATTGNVPGNDDFETSGVNKVVAGATWAQPTTSAPIWSGANDHTDSAVSPYLVLEFIIKVSDDEQ